MSCRSRKDGRPKGGVCLFLYGVFVCFFCKKRPYSTFWTCIQDSLSLKNNQNKLDGFLLVGFCRVECSHCFVMLFGGSSSYIYDIPV